MKIRLIFLLLALGSIQTFSQVKDDKEVKRKRAVELNNKAVKTIFSAGKRDDLFRQAIQLLDSAIKLDPKVTASYQNKIQDLIALDRYSEAISAANASLAIKQDVGILIYKGILLEKTGQIRLAKKTYKKVESIFTKFYNAHPALGPLERVAIAKFLVSDRTDALTYFEKEATKFVYSSSEKDRDKIKTELSTITKDMLLGKNPTIYIHAPKNPNLL
ncbi:hypothetical protein [Mucilaginibacter sp. CSA2-8R]|uniref:tetratricopeptide repeat protein n=1 Tax=Mucilaginibacter sp. CSA2-8R TaxID=3141542 RepID=UPI00315C8C04